MKPVLAPRLLGTLLALTFAIALPSAASAATPTPAAGVEVTQPIGEVLSQVNDGRVLTPNSIALSAKYRGLAYVMNQEGAPVVYVIQLSTGKVVGTTVLSGVTLDKPLGMAVDGGRLWIADLGDRRSNRFGGTIYRITEPPRGSRQATPTEYPVSFGGLASDINGLIIEPKSNQMYLVSRNDLANGTFWKLPRTLRAGIVNRALPESRTVTPGATDAAFTPNGSKVLVLADKDVRVFNARTWEEEVIVLPNPDTIPNGRGIAVAPDSTAFYVISEPSTAATTTGTTATPRPDDQSDDGVVISKFPLIKELGGVGVANETGGTAPATEPDTRKGLTLSPLVVGAGSIAVVAALAALVAMRIKRDRAVVAHNEKYGFKKRS
jgi:hypothetical protein